jgi:hypothetical protein
MTRSLARLPTNPAARVRLIVDRSQPDPDRPRLSEELEKRLEPIERTTAQCYAEAEELTYQIRRAAEAVGNGR